MIQYVLIRFENTMSQSLNMMLKLLPQFLKELEKTFPGTFSTSGGLLSVSPEHI